MNAPEIITDADRKVKDALDVWGKWFIADGVESLGIELSSIYGDSSSVKCWADVEHNGDIYLAENMDALIEDLPDNQKMAIFNKHIAAVFKSNRVSPTKDDYEQAVFSLGISMRKRYLL